MGLISWIAKRWKPITAALIAGVAFATVFVLCPAFGPAFLLAFAPSLGPALVGGLVAGATGQLARDLLDGETPGTDLIKPALFSAALSAGGMLAGGLALSVPWVAETAPLAKTIAMLTGAGGEAGASAASAGSTLGALKDKAGFIALNITPGPEDVIQIIEDPAQKVAKSAASALHGEPLEKARGIVRSLGDRH